MRYVDEDKLPVDVRDNALPEDNGKHYHMFYDERVRTSGGFTDVIFLVGIMVVSFLWGMLAVILK